MKRRLLLGLLMSAEITRALSQDGFTPQLGTLTYDVVDRNGRTFVNPSPDVAGIPFLKEEWTQGSIVINTNRRFDSVKIRINVFSQEVHFLDRNKNEMALAKGCIKEIFLPS